MDRGVLLLVSGLFISYSLAQTSNPEQQECQDLVVLKNNAETAFNKIPGTGGTLNCTPNTNCTGLSCSGKIFKKSFKGTVLLQGCQEPVSLFVHWNNKHMLVKDGQKINLWSKINVVPSIKKKDGIVHITLTLKLCLTKDPLTCIPYKILDNQKVRVHCNDSESDVPRLKPTDFFPTKTGGGPADVKQTDPSPYNASSAKPECKNLKSAEDSIENNFNAVTRKLFFPGSKIDCIPIANCTGLNCSGFLNKFTSLERFTISTTIDYCSYPATLYLYISMPDENINFKHNFKDGEEVEVSKMYQIYVTVHLKRQNDYINVTVKVEMKSVGSKEPIKNFKMPIDPNHCHGHYDTPISTTSIIKENSEGKSLSKGAIAGIAIASLVIFSLFVAFVVILVKGKRLSSTPAYYNNIAASDDTDPLYDDFEPAVA